MARPADPNARSALVAAARREFARRGLRGARIADITAACGLSKGAFYLHYDSKEALFGELVDGFRMELSATAERHRTQLTEFFASHGPITRRDIATRTSRYENFLELEMFQDLRLLEQLWENRDLVGVLLRGAQGTPFENAIWEMTERELSQIEEKFGGFQCSHACRADIPSEVFGSMCVGTYLLLAMRMSRMEAKPDLAEWARSLHLLIWEGSTPVEPARRQHRKSDQKKSASRSAR